MTELALRVSVLGEPNPLGIMGGQAEICNPLPDVGLPDVVLAGVSAEALRAVCKLVLTEVLVIQRGVTRVLRLRLGSSIAGRRAFQLEWLRAASTVSRRRRGCFTAWWRSEKHAPAAAGAHRGASQVADARLARRVASFITPIDVAPRCVVGSGRLDQQRGSRAR